MIDFCASEMYLLDFFLKEKLGNSLAGYASAPFLLITLFHSQY